MNNDNITQAAANKAAEEGGLPALPQEIEVGGEGWDFEDFKSQKTFSVDHMHEYARQAIAADRASRQVANKAEVEPDYWRAKCEAMIDIWDDAQANPPDSRCYVENAWPEIIVEVRMALATPPVTTGASTAGYEDQLRHCIAMTQKWASAAGEADGRAFKAEEQVLSLHRQLAAEKLRADQGWERAEAKSRECIDLRERMAGSVGASTVLTDERIKALWDETDAISGKPFTVAFARAIEREVAAQAGQVAVPADMTAAADFIDERAEQYLQDHADTEPGTGAIAFEFGEAGREYHSVLVELADDLRQASKPAACTAPPDGWNCTRTAGHEGPCAAAPSPAKESK